MRVGGAVCCAVLLCVCSCRVGTSTSRPSQRESSWWRTSLICSDAESAISLDCESPSGGLIVEDSELPPMRAFSGPGVAVLRGEHDRCTSLKVSCTGAPLPIDIFQYGGECRVHVILPGGDEDHSSFVCKIESPDGGMPTHFFALYFEHDAAFDKTPDRYYPSREPSALEREGVLQTRESERSSSSSR